MYVGTASRKQQADTKRRLRLGAHGEMLSPRPRLAHRLAFLPSTHPPRYVCILNTTTPCLGTDTQIEYAHAATRRFVSNTHRGVGRGLLGKIDEERLDEVVYEGGEPRARVGSGGAPSLRPGAVLRASAAAVSGLRPIK